MNSDRQQNAEDVFTFFHIPKNGGKSVEQWIKQVTTERQKKRLLFKSHQFDPQGCHNSVVILRDPVQRFVSAVHYHIQWFTEQNIHIPEDVPRTAGGWVDILMDSTHPSTDLLQTEMTTVRSKKGYHWIGERRLEYNWVFTPQHFWVHEPRVVMLLENIQSDWRYFWHDETVAELPTSNRSSKETLSVEHAHWIRTVYSKDDQIMYDRYKHLSQHERIPVCINH